MKAKRKTQNSRGLVSRLIQGFIHRVLRNIKTSNHFHNSILEQVQRAERFNMVGMAGSFVFLAVLDGFRALNTETAIWVALIRIGSVLVLSVGFLRIKIKLNYVSLFYSIYYVLIYISLMYLPRLYVDAPVYNYIRSEFLFHLFIIIGQGIRPGLFTGFLIFAVQLTYFVLRLAFNIPLALHHDNTELVVLFWLAVLTLAVEVGLFFHLIKYVELMYKKKQSDEELVLAEKVHKNLFPAFEENDRLKLTVFRTSENISGGDFYDLIRLREGNLGVFVTDVSGHGISSAMMSAAIKVIISQMPYPYRLDPSEFFSHLDLSMYAAYGSHHATAVYIYLDFLKKQTVLANAGHPYILFSRDKEPFKEIVTHGTLLGYNLTNPPVQNLEQELISGDRFFVYTDGLVEYIGTHESLPDVNMEKVMEGLEGETGDEIVTTILDRIKTRPDFIEFDDDVMLILIEVK